MEMALMGLLPNTPENPLLVFKYDAASKSFTKYVIHEYQDHGIGFGDINGDGRKDLVVKVKVARTTPNPGRINGHFIVVSLI